ncbi:MAG: CvpA family protein [Campylobacteraceae bacterium]|jgi:membrane protein required for colicin V production|nr:CvpA family protein [Campylobacteraceae bacterium]
MEFSWFDIVIVALILIFGIKGIAKGFVKELFEFIGIVGGIFLASRFASDAGVFINDNIYNVENEAAVRLIGFVGLLLAIFTVSILIGAIVSKIINFAGYSKLDKTLGFAFSVLTIFFVFSILSFAVSSIEFTKTFVTNALGNSFIYKKLCVVGEEIVDIHPSKFSNGEDIINKIEPIIEKSSEAIESLKDNISILILNNTDNNGDKSAIRRESEKD